MKYEPGYFEVSIIDQALVKNTNTGNSQIVLEVQPVKWSSFDGQANDQPIDDGQTRRIYMTITDNTKERIVSTLRAIGFCGGSISDIETKKEERDSRLIGLQVKAVMKSQEYQGSLKERWDLVSPRNNKSESPGEQLSAKDMLELDTRCAEVMAATGGEGKTFKPIPASQLGPAGPLDDTPF